MVYLLIFKIYRQRKKKIRYKFEMILEYKYAKVLALMTS